MRQTQPKIDTQELQARVCSEVMKEVSAVTGELTAQFRTEIELLLNEVDKMRQSTRLEFDQLR